MNLRYILGAFVSFPLLPIMYFQGKRIRASVPKLPEAEGTKGFCDLSKNSDHVMNVIFLGESTFAGVGVDTHKEGFAGTFAKELSKLFNTNLSWRVYARSGYTAKRLTNKLIPKITENNPTLIVIGLGGNDSFTLNRPSKWKTEIRLVIESLTAKFPGAMIVFCNMPPIKEFPSFTSLIKFTVGNLVEILGEELRKTVKEYDHVFYFGDKITLQGWITKYNLNNIKQDFFSDGVHPSKLTYQIWGKDIASEVFKNETLNKALTTKTIAQEALKKH